VLALYLLKMKRSRAQEYGAVMSDRLGERSLPHLASAAGQPDSVDGLPHQFNNIIFCRITLLILKTLTFLTQLQEIA
jgi:hypothetical protein